MITQSELKKILHYNKSTGIFTWKKTGKNQIKAGDVAGTINKNGYIHIKVNYKIYKAHRLAWLYVTGNYPTNIIDHKNHKREDNKFKNLRDTTHQNNNKNASKRKDNISGVVGVSWNKRYAKFVANININGKQKHLGYFKYKKDAIKARKDAEIQHKYHINHGKEI